MKNTLKIKINNLYNTKIEGVNQLHNDIELVKKIIQDNRFTFDEVIDILTSDNQLLKCIYDYLAFKRMDDNEGNTYDIVESYIYKFMCNHGKKLTSKHIELFFTCESELKKDDIAWLLLCGGQSYSLITEIANNLGIELSTKYVFAHVFVYDRGCVNLFEFQNISEYIEDIHLQQALKLRTFDDDVLDVILHKIIVDGNYSTDIVEKLCAYQTLSKDLVVKYKDYLDWISISRNQYFDAVEYIDYNFFREIKDYMIWGLYVCRNPVSENLYKIFADKLSWEEFKYRQQVQIDFKELQLTVDKWDNMTIDDYNEIFCHKVVMTPKQFKLVRNYHKILLYRDNSRYKCSLFDKIMLFFRCSSYFDEKLRKELVKSKFQLDGDYVIGYIKQDLGYVVNSSAHKHGLDKSYSSRSEVIYSNRNDDDVKYIKVKVNIHDIHTMDYHVWSENRLQQITANKFEFIYD